MFEADRLIEAFFLRTTLCHPYRALIPKPTPMKLKRSTPDEMVSIVQTFWTVNGGSLSGTEEAPQSFMVVPRYNALIRAHPQAVRAFFSYMGVKRSPRARVLELLLVVATRSRFVLNWLIRSGTVVAALSTSSYLGVKWSEVDALLSEWQFVACFSSKYGSVTHCLSDPKYGGHLRNELNARGEVVGIVPIPKLGRVVLEWPSGWTEAIVKAERKATPAEFDQIQIALLKLYRSSATKATVREYLSLLKARVEERYKHNEFMVRRMAHVFERVVELAGERVHDEISLARCHGDLSPSQVLVSEEGMCLIDWSESEVSSIFHDFVCTSLFYHRWRDFGSEIDVASLSTMRMGLSRDLRRYPPAFYIGVVLLEIGLKQHVDYNEGRGTLKGWSRLTDTLLDLGVQERAHRVALSAS